MSRLVVLDPGHGGSDPGACANGLKEKDLVSSISKFCKEYLESKGIQVLQTRDTDKTVSINERVAFANKHKAALFISIHTNAGGGDGVEVIYSVTGGTSLKMAQEIVDSINQVTGQNKRPKEIYTKVNDAGHDYFGVIRQTSMPAVIVECAFIDSKDVEIIDTSEERKLMGRGIGEGILKVLGTSNVGGTPIIGPATATLEQCQEWAIVKKPKQIFIDNLSIYFKECLKVGINPVVAIVQYTKETGYGKFGGVLDETYRNPCGLKETASGKDDCTIAEAHKRFDTWEDGIKAHIDHLALYAGVNGYPKSNTLDPRHFSYLKGEAPTVEALGGNWCPSATYGHDLLRMMKEVEETKVQAKDEYQEALKVLNQEGVVNTLSVWKDKDKIKPNNVPKLIINCARKIQQLKNGIR
ncbi:N-acetylmuramoyl-L-alanine amidase [Niameybacter massiliensis]|uniref:N-acetylmuramoyl-L-alanine amidase n=1 Tax=Niameybacter massiliensis TaxID=1658108 RepID=UPI0006B5FAD5|nr:N-acetylmuramoyl-L-alanine amidase [Niameybacter massiliensis]